MSWLYSINHPYPRYTCCIVQHSAALLVRYPSLPKEFTSLPWAQIFCEKNLPVLKISAEKNSECTGKLCRKNSECTGKLCRKNFEMYWKIV